MTKCLCTGMIYDPEVVARQQAAAKKAAKGEVIAFVQASASCCGGHVGGLRVTGFRSAMKHTANL